MQLRNKKLSTSRWVPGRTAVLVKWEDHSASRDLKGILLSEALGDNPGVGTVNFLSAGFFIKEDKGCLVMTDTIEFHDNPSIGMVRTIISHDILELKVL